MGLTALAIRRPLAVLMGIMALVLMGGVAYTYLHVDRLPPVSIGVVSVSVSWPNASAENVERLVAEPLENAVSGISGVDTITSNSSQGSCNVIVSLVDGYDPNQADIDIQQAMGPVLRQLPTNATAPVVRKFDPNASPIMSIGFTGAPLDQLYDLASNQLQPDLESIPGVGQVSISGGLQREIQVQLDYTKLAGYNISVQQVSSALSAANVSVPSGSVSELSRVINVVPQGLFQNVDDIKNVVITNTPSGGSVTVGDVATVQASHKTQYSLQRLNGQDAVGLNITANADANTVQVADAVQAELRHLQSLLPQGTTTTVVEDQSLFTRASLASIQHDLGIAIFLVATVILIFLHEWRHTIIVLCAIPTSLISTFLVMYLLGFTLNTMSMMALALMIGILVDDSIVVLENIHRHLKLGEHPWRAALIGRSEIGMAAVAITMADVVVYTPIAFMSGSIGQLFRQYGLTVVAATLLSMLMSFTLTPMLASRWLSHSEGPGRFSFLHPFAVWWDRGFEQVGHFFARTVPYALRARWLVLLIAVGMVAAAAAMIPLHILGTEYAPAEDDNSFEINLTLPPGTSLDATNQAAQQLEGYVKAMPEVTYYFTSANVPGGGGFSRGGSSTVNIRVQTVDKSERKRSVFDMINALRGQSRQIPAANFSGGVSSPLPGGGGGGGGGIFMQVTGPDLDGVNELASEAQATLQAVPGISDVNSSNLATVPEVDIHLNSQVMAQLGLTNQQVDQALATAIGGTAVTQFQPSGQQAQDITLEAVNSARYDLSTLSQVPVGVVSASGTTGSGVGSSSASGSVITLGQIATLTSGTGPVTIQRINRQVAVSVTASAVGRPLGDVANDVQGALKTMSLQPGYSITLRGSVQIFNQAITALGAVLVLSFVLEYMLLVALYESFLFPVVRMLTVPLGMVGAFLLLWATGNTINIFSIIGMIMGEGLVAKSGILLVDYTNTLREQGWGRTEALQEAARVRLRPILMTSATMIFGMLPLALKLEAGAETRSPMAVVVIGALISSTFLTLLVVPALYTMMDDLQTRLFGAPRTPEEVAELETLLANTTPLVVAGAEHGAVPAGMTEDGDGNGHRDGNGRGDGNGHGRGGAPVAARGPKDGSNAAVATVAAPDVAVATAPALNVEERSKAYVVRASVPGARYEDIDVRVHGDILTVSGGGRPDHGQSARWQRSLVLPQGADGDGLTATYDNGVLELRLPKTAAASGRRVPVSPGRGPRRRRGPADGAADGGD